MTPKVTAEVAATVLTRDLAIAGGCVPAYLGAPPPCADKWGEVHPPNERLTLNHVREHSGGRRRSEVRWLTSGCWRHSVQGWELSHVQQLRDYLANVSVL